MNAPTNLATQDFWEDDYYRGIKLPVRPDSSSPFDRCLARALRELAPLRAGASVLEIGCAPAGWLLWYAETFGALVTGLEYSPKGVMLSRENLAAADISGEIHDADFFSADLNLGQFDLVLSLGFIEHFDDVEATFARHVAFLRPGGRLVVGMPNFRGLIGFFQRWADHDFLKLHNRRAMKPGLYRQIAAENGLRLDDVRYIDGIDPDMVRVTRTSARVALMPFRAWRILRVSDRVNASWASSYLVLAFTQIA